MKQLSFFKKQTTEFGGENMKGRRKCARPVDSRRPLFLTLKATSSEYFLANKNEIEELLNAQSRRVGARIFSLAIQADHLHLAIQFGSPLLYRRWIRATTGLLARRLPGVRWRHRPHSEIVNWGRHLGAVLNYIDGNRQEAGLIEWSHLSAEEFRENKWRPLWAGARAV